jgi:serine protease SohB
MFDFLRRLVPGMGSGQPLVAVLRLSGPIGVNFGPGRPSLSLTQVARDLENAFRLRGVKTVALAVNSPGGSPVQSNLIYSRIRALAEEYEVPVVTFTEDVAASGGYWIALAGDEVYADPNSIVGSIGVISAGFGFPELLKKIGVERRLYTSGDNKGMLDSFSDEKATDVKRLKELQKRIHDSFKAIVRDRRGEKLSGAESKIFSGEFWTGAQALSLGLVDGLGDLRTVMRARFGDKVRLKVVGRRGRRFGITFRSRREAPAFTDLADWPDRLLGALEVRAMWSRFGL